MTLSEKSAYLKGLMEGMKLDTETNEGKLISEIISMLQDVAENVSDLEEVVDCISDELDCIEEDLDNIDDYLMDDDDDEYDDEYDEDDDYEDRESGEDVRERLHHAALVLRHLDHGRLVGDGPEGVEHADAKGERQEEHGEVAEGLADVAERDLSVHLRPPLPGRTRRP